LTSSDGEPSVNAGASLTSVTLTVTEIDPESAPSLTDTVTE